MDNIGKTVRAGFALGVMAAAIWLVEERLYGKFGCLWMRLGSDTDEANFKTGPYIDQVWPHWTTGKYQAAERVLIQGKHHAGYKIPPSVGNAGCRSIRCEVCVLEPA